MRAKEISDLLANRALDVVKYLLPAGVKRADEWCIGSVYGEAGNSLKIRLYGTKAGIWSDFATGQSGDLLDLWALCDGQGLTTAMKEAKVYLGIKDVWSIGSARSVARQEEKSFKKPDPQKLEKLSDLSPAMIYLKNDRFLEITTIEKFNIMQSGDDIAFPYYSSEGLVFIKYLKIARADGKKHMYVEKDCKPILFGWQTIPKAVREITICEGEIDAMSLTQDGIPALSVPLGAGTGAKHDWITHEFDNLSHYDKIYICMDNDDAGFVAAKEIAERLGYHRCPIVQLPFKDANECLQNGIIYDDIKYFFDNALTIDPEELKKASLFRDKTKEVFTTRVGEFVGYEPFLEHSRGKVLFRPNELSIWTGINGHGKSQFLGELIVHMITQGAKVCIASMELKPARVLARMCRQATAMREPSEDYLDAVFDKWEGHLWLFELVGTAKSKRLLEVFLYARQRYGIDVFVIDSFLTLDIAEDDYKAQKEFIEQLRDFKNTHNCQIHIVVHPRKPTDESIVPNKMDIKGTGAITDLSDNCFTIWRDKIKEILINKQNSGQLLSEKEAERINRSDGLWRCDKQRHGDWEGVIRIWFDKDSLQYRDSEGKKPKPYITWSKNDTGANG
jgi:twinkle protein